VAVTTTKQTTLPAADMQWRARKIAMQASRLADQAGPTTRRAALTARRGAGSATNWAKPRVGRIRAWMAVRAARGSIAVQESFAPRVSAMLAATARRLDPPRPRSSRRWPKVLAGTALLAAGAAAATAMALRRRRTNLPMYATQRPSARSGAEPASSVLGQSTDTERASKETEVNGLTRTR
jgi:hypothetical protein